jgi:DNA primase
MIGRVLGESGEPPTDGPKYLGLPGAKPLLGWDDAIRDDQAVCLVEGPMDVLALRLWGIPGLALDDDTGGHEGADRLEVRLGRRAMCVQLPEGAKDVAELLTLPRGQELFRSALSTARATNET